MDSSRVGLSLVGTGSNPDGRPDTDFYATPRWATEALLDRERFGHHILEPACGDGAISKVMTEYGHDVWACDLYDHGYGNTDMDFLTENYDRTIHAIVTNPPYRLAEEFLTKALDLTNRWERGNGKVALLLKLQFLEGQKRKKLLEESPLKAVYVFSKRLTFTRNNQPIGNSGMMAFAWYIWDWSWHDEPVIRWI